MKALLIENSRLYHAYLSRQFSGLGYEPVVADSRATALECLARDSYHVICMNLYFEGTNAIEFVREIRARDPNVIVIVLTSEKSNSVRLRAIKAGVTEVIYKSRPEELSGLIASCLQQQYNAVLRGCRVLYVEDSRTQATLIRGILEGMGLTVQHCTTAESAMLKTGKERYDLIITDILLKGEASGLALLRHVRGLPGQACNTPVLAMTGFDDAVRRVELFRAGISDYITKPVLEEELVVRVSNLISNKLLVDKVAGQQAELYEMAMRDRLTGCYNRHGLQELAHDALLQIPLGGELSLMVLDLDLFKKINDNHGHDMGDKVLKAVGSLLRKECRQDDLVARYGGEEFVVMLPNCRKDAAQKIARRLRAKVEAMCPEGLRITASIGLTSLGEGQSPDLEAMFKSADRALYRAKARGRNRVSYRGLPLSGQLRHAP